MQRTGRRTLLVLTTTATTNRPIATLTSATVASAFPVAIDIDISIINMSAQNTASIQTLLEAEKDAQQIVEKARQYRTQRLKDARSEAQKEIEKYKSKKESEFKEYEAKV